MKHSPIIMSADSVHKSFADQKTQTRRVVVRMHPKTSAGRGNLFHGDRCRSNNNGTWNFWSSKHKKASFSNFPLGFPYGRPGDLLYVVETLRVVVVRKTRRFDASAFGLWYADKTLVMDARNGEPAEVPGWWFEKWQERGRFLLPAHTLRSRPELSRLWLRNVSERIEPLHAIHHREDELRAEGIVLPPWELYPHTNTSDKLERYFVKMWDSLNAKRGFSWGFNPWVRPLTYERTERPA